MPRRVLLPATAAVLWLSSVAPAAVPQTPESFTVAVVGDDGVLVPFGRFDGSTWERVWSEPSPDPVVPASLEDVPKTSYPPDGRVPSQWFLWPTSDPKAATSPFEMRAARPVTLVRPTRVEARCLAQVGLVTDYDAASPRPADAMGRRSKAGVAVTLASLRVEQANVVGPESPLVKAILERAGTAFHRAEDDQIEVLEAEQRKIVPAFAVRRTVPVAWTAVVRLGVAQAPARTYYLEGETQYGSLVMTGHVWVQITADRETTDAEVMVTDRDRKESRHRVPLGILRMGDQRLWVFETDQWKHESYEIVEVSGQGLRPVSLLEVAGGGCP